MFSLTQQIDAPPVEVARAFTEPEPFAAWFVAEGFTTPADRVRIDARPGGSVSAVFVAGDTEVPFTLGIADLELPRRVVLRFDDPAEVITVDLRDAGDGRTLLEYHSTGLDAEQDSEIRPGVAKMLARMAAYFSPDRP